MPVLDERVGEVADGTPVLSGSDLRRVRAVLYLNGLRGADLDDAAQDVQLRLLEQPAGSVDTVGAWACAVAARLAVDRHRRARTRSSLADRLRVHRPGAHLDPDVALTESVRRALRQLEPDLRATVVLRYYADLSVAEIARLLDVAEGTVKSRLHRAEGVLRNALREDA
jgi:RNA polymerase sigma-70 factor, ECF subfamily